MMKAFAYLRVSTAEQVQTGCSLEEQQARIEAFCTANGHELLETFTDAGISGKRAENRPGLQAAKLAAIKARGLLVVVSLSRFSRSTRQSIELAEELDRAGAALVSLTEHIDFSTATGRMVFNVLAAQCQFEREMTAERIRAILQHKKRLGQRVGAIPFGYDLADDGKHLRENAEEQQVIELIQDLQADGLSVRKIAAQLNELKHKTKQGRPWNHVQVHRTLKATELKS
jgi:DNA invertase Pin-like site-specific DNA recombinase